MSFIPATKTSDSGVPDSRKPIYLNTAYSFEERAADLVSRMTLEEKQSQLGNTMPAIPRLGVNAYNVWGEALHGVMNRWGNFNKPATSFPNSVALGSSWDPVLAQRETSAISEEARGFNADVISTLTFWSPVVEPARDPRWGRTGESFGEDPFLVEQIAGGFIRGMMGNDPTYLKVVPIGKHFLANNSEFNRHTGSSDMDNRDQREFYLAPYRKLIERDKLPAIMSSYNAVNGIPVTSSKFFVDTIARRTYGLKGYVTGDCGAVSDIYANHHFAKSNAEAAAMGLKAGVDTDCGSVYQSSTIEAINEGLLTEADVDRALVNLFTIRMRTGEFDPKSKVPYSLIQSDVINSKGNIALAEEVATKTPVLLKNISVANTNKKALPLNASGLKKIAIIGPQADKVELGPYSGSPSDSNKITPLAGIKNYLVKNGMSAEVSFSSGANSVSRSDLFSVTEFGIIKTDGSVTNHDAAKFAASAKGIIVSSRMSNMLAVRGIKDGDWTSYNNIDISNIDSINISLSVTGPGGIIEARLGSATGNLLAKFDVPGNQPGGRRMGGFGRSKPIAAKANNLGATGNQTIVLVYHAPDLAPIDKETIDMAASSDVAVVFVGTDDRTAGEESDRFSLVLPGNQYELIKAVAAANPNTIVVIQSLGMVEVDQFKDIQNVAGIVWTGFNGQAQGTAIARILFGNVNPGGKLNATWYKSVNDLPELTDYNLRGGPGKNGRTYWYFNKDVSYEFGFGLSYTTFEYSNFKINKTAITPNDKITVSVDVKNTGSVDGDEVVQVYMRTPDSPASMQRPIKRLKGFQRVTIPAGQTKTVNINIDCTDLWFWDGSKNNITFDKGKYIFEIGASSKDIKGNVEATMSGSYNSVLKTVVARSNKTVLKSGSTVQTSVTASMSDDRFYDINKANITYSSNNPRVATVNEKGLVTAMGVGVATISAHVTIDGKTVSDSYPVKIMPNLKLSNITVNGKNMTGFRPDVQSYSFLLAQGAKIPQIEGKQAVADITVETDQAKSVPGTTVITLTDNVTVEKNEYLISFGYKSVNDEFNGTLGKEWSWVRENTSDWSLTKRKGALVITSEEGDLQNSTNNARNILLQDANTDWTINSKLIFSRKPTGFSQQGGLLAYQDDDNYVKLIYRAGSVRRGFGGFGGAGAQSGILELVVEKDGDQSTAAILSATDIINDNNTIFFRLEKKGADFTAFYSTNGKNFKSLGTTNAILRNVKAGIIVCDGVPQGRMRNFPGMQQQTPEPEAPFEVAYDYFHIINTGLK